VVDSRGNIYGHLVVGDLENKIGYIIPATQTFDNMKQQIGNDLSTIRPPLTNLDAPISPKSREQAGNDLATTQSEETAQGEEVISRVRQNREQLRHRLDPQSSSESRTLSGTTLLQPTIPTSNSTMTRLEPTIWDNIELGSPSMPSTSKKEADKYTERDPRRSVPSASNGRPGREIISLRSRYYLRILNMWLDPPPRVPERDQPVR
jgi:hypothetical protein